MEVAQVEQVIGLIYEGALTANWQPALAALSRASGCHHVVMLGDAIGGRLPVGSGSQTLEASYVDQFAGLNDALPALLAMPIGVPALDRTLLDLDRYQRGIFWNEFARPNGLIAASGGVAMKSADGTTALIFNRPERQAETETSDLAWLRLVLPHVRRALLLEALHAPALHGGFSAWCAANAGDLAAIVIDANGRIVVANAAGQQILAADGLLLDRSGTHSGRSVPPDVAALLPESCAADGRRRRDAREVLSLRLGGGRRSCRLRDVLPLPGPPAWLGARCSCYALLLERTEDARGRTSLLVATYGLTRREAEVVVRLGSRDALSEVAVDLGIRLSTTKTLLGRAMDKIGLHSQARLIRMVERLPI